MGAPLKLLVLKKSSDVVRFKGNPGKQWETSIESDTSHHPNAAPGVRFFSSCALYTCKDAKPNRDAPCTYKAHRIKTTPQTCRVQGPILAVTARQQRLDCRSIADGRQ